MDGVELASSYIDYLELAYGDLDDRLSKHYVKLADFKARISKRKSLLEEIVSEINKRRKISEELNQEDKTLRSR